MPWPAPGAATFSSKSPRQMFKKMNLQGRRLRSNQHNQKRAFFDCFKL